MADQSPVTGVISEEEVIIDFGKYIGMTVSEVSKTDPEFYNRLIREKEQFAIRRHKDKTFRLYITPAPSTDH